MVPMRPQFWDWRLPRLDRCQAGVISLTPLHGDAVEELNVPSPALSTTGAFTPLRAGLIMEETFVGLRHRAYQHGLNLIARQEVTSPVSTKGAECDSVLTRW